MTFVLGRDGGLDAGPTVDLGTYRAVDGSRGASVHLDVDRPHAVLTVGKRGYGKSHTLGVVAEDLARAEGLAPVVVDPVGAFSGLDRPADGRPVPASVIDDPAVAPSSLDPRSWCELLALSPESGAGSLLWRAAAAADTLDGMAERVESADAPDRVERAAVNHLRLADSWGVFDADGLSAADVAGSEATVVDVSGVEQAAANAVVRGVAEALYRARVTESVDRLPWLLVDEAHAFFDGVAGPALERVLTRGRTPGVSLVAATQRPAAVPAVAVSQSDVIVSHRLTAESDLDRLRSVSPTYLADSLAERIPVRPGDALVADDATETAHTTRVRRRATPHGGSSPLASEAVIEG